MSATEIIAAIIGLCVAFFAGKELHRFRRTEWRQGWLDRGNYEAGRKEKAPQIEIGTTVMPFSYSDALDCDAAMRVKSPAGGLLKRVHDLHYGEPDARVDALDKIYHATNL